MPSVLAISVAVGSVLVAGFLVLGFVREKQEELARHIQSLQYTSRERRRRGDANSHSEEGYEDVENANEDQGGLRRRRPPDNKGGEVDDTITPILEQDDGNLHDQSVPLQILNIADTEPFDFEISSATPEISSARVSVDTGPAELHQNPESSTEIEPVDDTGSDGTTQEESNSEDSTPDSTTGDQSPPQNLLHNNTALLLQPPEAGNHELSDINSELGTATGTSGDNNEGEDWSDLGDDESL